MTTVYRYVVKAEKFTLEPKILRCELVSETLAFATLNIPDWRRKARQDRIKKTGQVFNTWEEAHNELMARAHRQLNQARLQLQRAQSLHGSIVGMRPPADETTTTEPPC